jgi:5-methyltetrahydropteroyltriglutamate--homocysteine methyltransferase
MTRNTPPFRADHVGSLLRTSEVLKARGDHQHGRINDAQLRAIEDAEIRKVVKMQEDVGLSGVTDGEYRRGSWHMDFLYQVGGVTSGQDKLRLTFHNEQGDLDFMMAGPRVYSKLKFEKCIFADDFQFLKSVATTTPKLSIPSPSMLHYRGGRASIDASVYPDLEEFWHDLGAVYAEQIAALGKLGCTYLQLDDTSLAYLNDPAQREYITNLGGNAQQHLTYIRLINAALAKRPPGMTICTHMCRGNFRSSWVASGGYDYVAEALFGELQVYGFFMEFDDARSGGFEPLRFVPKGKIVVLGLVSSKRGALENKDDLKRRIDEAAKYVPLEQLCLSPQCGFSSTVEGNALTIDDEIAKLRLVVETAREVWG